MVRRRNYQLSTRKIARRKRMPEVKGMIFGANPRGRLHRLQLTKKTILYILHKCNNGKFDQVRCNCNTTSTSSIKLLSAPNYVLACCVRYWTVNLVTKGRNRGIYHTLAIHESFERRWRAPLSTSRRVARKFSKNRTASLLEAFTSSRYITDEK